MKNYKNRQETPDEKKLRFIVESRLQLQSIQQYLDGHNIRQRSFEYFKSPEFMKKHFVTWTAFQRKNFLVTMVGDDWQKLQSMLLEKEEKV